MKLPVLNEALSAPRAASRAQPVGRRSDYTLRASVLDQCQYRCGYCRPAPISPATERARWLTVADHQRLARLMSCWPLTTVRFTGGEPLLRRDLVDIVAAWSDGIEGLDVALTTNGQHLARLLRPLHDAGLQRATVHIDSLRPDRYRTLMGDGDIVEVLEGVRQAARVLKQVKLNVVVQRGRNDDEIGDFIAWSSTSGVEVRFIEIMNTGSAREFAQSAFFTGREIVEQARRTAPVVPLARRSASDPAALWSCGGVTFGVVASDTEPFCDACNRLRLTVDGRLRGCLYEDNGASMRSLLQQGADDEVAALIESVIDGKRSFHPRFSEGRVPFSMGDVGG